LHPKARGTVRLASNDPAAAPKIDPNYFGHPDDLATTVAGLKMSRELFAMPALAKQVNRILLPDDSLTTDEELGDFVRHHARTSYHPVGTCRMGSDATAVVDTELRLSGFEGVPLSAMPASPAGQRMAESTFVGKTILRIPEHPVARSDNIRSAIPEHPVTLR